MPKPTTFAEAVPVIVDLADKQYDLVHGDENTVVQTDNGPVPSAAKAVADLNAAYAAQDVVAVSAAARDEAQAAAVTASAAAQASLTNGQKYATVAEGHAATADGGYFDVIGDNITTEVIRYQRTSSTTDVIVTESPAKAVVDGLRSMIAPDSLTGASVLVKDEDGFISMTFDADGGMSSKNARVRSDNGFKVTRRSDGVDLAVFDGLGNLTLPLGQQVTIGDLVQRRISWPVTPAPVSVKMDVDGFILSAEMPDGSVVLSSGITAGLQVTIGDFVQRKIAWPATPAPVSVKMDLDGFVLSAEMPNGTILLPGGVVGGTTVAPTTSYTQEEIDARNAQNLAYSQKLKTQINTNFQGLTADINIVIGDGQSLENGFRSFPPITTTPRASGLWMLGGCVRPVGVRSGTTFAPVGGVSNLQPLKAVAQDFSGNVITDYSTLDPTGGGMGETMVEAQAAFVKIMTARRMGLNDNAGPEISVVNCGVDGKSVEQLSKGANPNLYNRVIDAVTQIKAIATAAGKTCAVVLLDYNQGEYNYNGAGTTDKATYKALLTTLLQNLQTDLCAITGQTLPFITLLGQSGANWTVDATSLSIGTAQLELSQEFPNVRLASPYYHLPVKSDGHFTANGARWYSCLYGKVAYRMLRGEDWQPVSVRKITYRAQQVLFDFIVPEPPIKFFTPYVGEVTQDFATKGFSFVDDTGYMLPTSVSIVSDTQILCTLPRAVNGVLRVRIADKTTHAGRTCVQDSDAMLSLERYSYTPNNGQADSENIAALVGNPYPQNNVLAAGQFVATNI